MVTLLKVGCVLSKLTVSPSVSLLIVVRSVPALPALSVKAITKAMTPSSSASVIV